MSEQRRVKAGGRPVYGRVQPLARPMRRRPHSPSLSPRGWRFIALMMMALAGWLVLGAVFAVQDVKVVAPARGEEIKATVSRLIDASWRQRNLLTLDGPGLESKLQQTDLSLRSVVVRRQWPRGIVVSVTFKQPSLGWASGNQQFLLDRDGTAIGLLPAGSSLPVVWDGSNLPVQVGQRVASARFVAFAGEVVPALAARSIGVTRLDIKDTTADLTVTTNKGYRLLFDSTGSVEQAMGSLNSVLALLANQKRTPAEYIDLRVAGKAYYK